MDRHLHQLHVWVREEDYRALKQLAASGDESLGRLVRRQLRSLIRNCGASADPTLPRTEQPFSPRQPAARPRR